MPTCIEKLCNGHHNCREREIRRPKCLCMRNEPICSPLIVEKIVEHEHRNPCHNHSCTKLDSDFKCENAKPLNVRLKLQLVNDGKNTGGCLCAKYFEMLDACYGGVSPGCGQRSSPGQGPCTTQPPQFPYMPQAPYFHEIPVPFPLNYQQIMPAMGDHPVIPINHELYRGIYNAKPQDECRSACNSPRMQPAIKFRENDTQTDKNDYNKCMIACEEYVEKLLSTDDKRYRCESERKEINAVSCSHIETLTHINAALVGITGTLQEIQKALQHQPIDNCLCNEDATILRQYQKLNRQIDNCCSDPEPQMPRHNPKFKPPHNDNKNSNSHCFKKPQKPRQQTKLLSQQIDACLCDDPYGVAHPCYCGDERELQNTHYSSKQSNFDPPKTLRYSDVAPGNVPFGYISSATGRLIPYTDVRNVSGPQAFNTPGFWPFIPKSMPPPPPPIPPPFRILPWDDVPNLTSAQENRFNHQKFKYEPPRITQPFSNSSATFNPMVSSRLTFPGFSCSTVTQTPSHATASPPPFGTIPITTSGIDTQFTTFGTNISSSTRPSLHGTPFPFPDQEIIPFSHPHGASVLTNPLHGTVSHRNIQQSSLISKGVASPNTSLQGRHEKTSRVSRTSAVPQPPPLTMPSIAENTVLSNNASAINFMPSGSTSTHMSLIDELKSKSHLRCNVNVNTTLLPNQVNTASPKNISQGEVSAGLKIAVERKKLQGSKHKESRLPVAKRIVHTSFIGRRFHDAMRHKIKNIRKDSAPSCSGSEKSNFDDHDLAN